ncbi:hypothetical protein [Bacillus velezensis]|uniref:hypothetical protein n=1 Tax=Bacillus velezensis TaxID=492670 RepID=UPI0027320070|nr:hypothetical protein [Bacillus velezensis]MDP1497538.1 hypothetical protein [Bacillus velezensis]
MTNEILKELKSISITFIKFLCVLAVLTIIAIISWHLKAYEVIYYIMVIVAYLIIWFLIYCCLIRPQRVRRDNLYLWLDQPNLTDKEFIHDLSEVPVKDLLENLETIYKKLLIYAKLDIIKLKLLKAYFKTKNSGNIIEVLFRSLVAIISGPLLLFVINNRQLFVFLKPKDFAEINPTFLTVANILTIVLFFLSVLMFFISDSVTNKKRNLIIEEILDVCISECSNKK